MIVCLTTEYGFKCSLAVIAKVHKTVKVPIRYEVESLLPVPTLIAIHSRYNPQIYCIVKDDSEYRTVGYHSGTRTLDIKRWLAFYSVQPYLAHPVFIIVFFRFQHA